ncbi:MAG TPA: helix-turn-helix domain-containing protein [Polyangiaceae bacterium]|jgi:transcriptional regulator with XRE-family HTH domain|nr:helix-turn-helix domain-containing protein [Polyangiaceae bacterium]
MGASTITATVGRAIRASRQRAKLPLARVARKCRLSPTQLDGIECGRSRPSPDTLARIAHALGTDVVDLVVDPHREASGRLSVAEIARAILELPEEVGSKIDVIQQATVLVALTACRENQSAAARMLGMERKAFTRKLSRARRRKLSRRARPDPAASARRAG